ncbi:MAG: VWA domain-containing protein [Phycisphaerales bacterium]
MLDGLRFETPWAFVLLLVPIALLARRVVGRHPAAPVLFSSLLLTDSTPRTLRQRLAWAPDAAILLGMTALVVALARPQWGTGQVRTKARGVAIMMVVDRSFSMSEMIDDRGASRSRIEVVKRVFREFVEGNDGDGGDLEGRPHDLIGLVAFSGFAETICPLVRIHDRLVELSDAIELTDGRSMESGTAVGAGLSLAAARLERAEADLQSGEGDPDFEIKSKIIILLTDGDENIRNPPMSVAADLCAELGVKIYAIGIGGGGGRQSMFGGAFGQRFPFREGPLRDIAERTGGVYRGVTDGASLRDVYAEIDRLETTEIETIEHVNYAETYRPWALAGGALVASGFLLRLTWFRRLP